MFEVHVRLDLSALEAHGSGEGRLAFRDERGALVSVYLNVLTGGGIEVCATGLHGVEGDSVAGGGASEFESHGGVGRGGSMQVAQAIANGGIIPEEGEDAAGLGDRGAIEGISAAPLRARMPGAERSTRAADGTPSVEEARAAAGERGRGAEKGGEDDPARSQ